MNEKPERCPTCRLIQVSDNADCPCSCQDTCECHDAPKPETQAGSAERHHTLKCGHCFMSWVFDDPLSGHGGCGICRLERENAALLKRTEAAEQDRDEARERHDDHCEGGCVPPWKPR